MKKFKDDDCDALILGRLELAYATKDDSNWNSEGELLLQEFLPSEMTFTLLTLHTDLLDGVNGEIEGLWMSGVVTRTLKEAAAERDFATDVSEPVLLTTPEAVFTGLTILLVFILLLLALAIRDLATRKERAVQTKIPEAQPLREEVPSPGLRGNTLSLGSFSPKDGGGRPGEEWMQAVPVDDIHAQGIQNIQEYENELSAVPQANPSLGVSDSVFSLFKLEKRKT